MTTKSAGADKPARKAERSSTDLQTAYQIHTLAQMLYGRLAATHPWAAPVWSPPYAAMAPAPPLAGFAGAPPPGFQPSTAAMGFATPPALELAAAPSAIGFPPAPGPDLHSALSWSQGWPRAWGCGPLCWHR